jgi:hypothetical protein
MDKKERTQTTPAGAEIPVPTRREVFDDLAKAAQPARKAPKKHKRKK